MARPDTWEIGGLKKKGKKEKVKHKSRDAKASYMENQRTKKEDKEKKKKTAKKKINQAVSNFFPPVLLPFFQAIYHLA